MTRSQPRGRERGAPHVWARIETVFGTLVCIGLLTPAPRAVLRIWMTGATAAAASLPTMLRVDTVATATAVGLSLAKMGLALLPAILLLRCVPRRRWLWLVPLVGILVVASSPLSLAAASTPLRWMVLGLSSSGAILALRIRYLRWAALLPFAVLWEVVPSHGLAGIRSADLAYRKELLSHCRRRDGVLPANLSADQLMPYHGINVFDDGFVLLSGEGALDGGMRGNGEGRYVGSWWLRRVGESFRFEEHSDATGNLWRGCRIHGTVWMARANFLVGARRLPAGEGMPHEEVIRKRLPSEDIDFGETACDPEGETVYITEASLGGMWEVPPDAREPRRHEVGGIVLLPKRRFDGRLVITNSAELMLYDPAEGRIVSRQPVGIADFGFDVCDGDGRVAIADMTGRLRIFEATSQDYRFAWGVSLFAPRRVAWSPDCRRLAVTSADDHSVYLIDTEARAVVERHQAGPALREVAATGAREFSVTDTCSMTTYRW